MLGTQYFVFIFKKYPAPFPPSFSKRGRKKGKYSIRLGDKEEGSCMFSEQYCTFQRQAHLEWPAQYMKHNIHESICISWCADSECNYIFHIQTETLILHPFPRRISDLDWEFRIFIQHGNCTSTSVRWLKHYKALLCNLIHTFLLTPESKQRHN